MATQLVQVGRHRFICGLFWQSLSRRHELRAEARELAARLNFDAMVLRIDRGFAGAGFASTREGAPLGVPSLGALVSKAIATEGAFYDGRQQSAPNWLGAFSLADGRWAYFAVRDGAFLPNGDWVGTSEEVFERLHSDYSLGGWNVVIGDPRVEVQGFHCFYARKLEDMLPRRAGKERVPRWTRLVPVSRRVQWRRVAVAAAVMSVLGGAVYGGWTWRQQRLEQARERAFAAGRAKLMRANAAAAQAPLHPWSAQPTPAAFVEACLTRFAALAPGGWQLDDYVCRASSVSYRWSRNDSNVALLLAAQPRANVDSSGDHASLVAPLALPAGGDDRIDGIRGERLRLLSSFQLLGVGLAFTLQPPPAAPRSATAQALGQVGIGGKGQDAPPPWRTWRIRADLGDLWPSSVTAYLEQPGVRLDQLTWRAGQWSIEGVVYEQ